jgi:CRISPR-associated protein Cmr4
MTFFQSGALLFLYMETMSHVGAAESAIVDLAIQRNPLTQWPMIQSTSLKGSLRAAAPGKVDNPDVKLVFGAGAANGDNAGSLSVGDASLLAFPVASLAGVFGWVTCPLALRDCWRTMAFLPGSGAEAADLAMLDALAVWPADTKEDVALHAKDCELVTNDRIVLQDMLLFPRQDDRIEPFATWLTGAAQPGTDAIRAKLKRDLLIVHDDVFADLVEGGVHIATRVQIKPETGTVGQGPWDEELLPAETILYAPLQARFLDPKKGTPNVPDLDGVIPYVSDYILADSRRFQIGAGSTIGWGIAAGTVYNVQ